MSDSARTNDHLPADLMGDVAWSFFDGEPFENQRAFEERVAEHHRQIGAPDAWRPGEIAIHVPRLRVKYFGADPEDEFEYADYEAELASANGESFTNGELLFRLHNAVAPHLRQVDHCYFEGLALTGPPAPGEPPLYEMRQGS